MYFRNRYAILLCHTHSSKCKCIWTIKTLLGHADWHKC